MITSFDSIIHHRAHRLAEIEEKRVPTVFENDLTVLRREIIQMGGLTEQLLKQGVDALINGRADLCLDIIKGDREINDRETMITDTAILLIATNQPVAGDLRFLASCLRTASELERMGDLAANLARRAMALAGCGTPFPLPDRLIEMAGETMTMVTMALDSISSRDTELAEKVLTHDDVIDDMETEIRDRIIKTMATDGGRVGWGIEIINTAAHLERLGDHAANLAEETIYIVKGQNVRHHFG